MLAALCAIVHKERLFCLHVEHGIRPQSESGGDADHVRDFCEKNGIACTVVSVAPGKAAALAKKRGIGLEAAARFFRRRALFRKAAQLGENTKILIAHTKDDALETILMRVLRGAGPAGLAAMPQSRGRILRPLLNCSRAEVIEYLKEKNISWREDSTNTDENFLRNRIRRRLIPLLNEFFPSWKSGVNGMAETQSLTAAFLAEETQKRVTWTESPGALVTDAENFFTQAQLIREEAIFLGVNIISTDKKSAVPKRSTVRRFCRGAAKTVDLGALRITQKDGKIVISKEKNRYSEKGFSLLIKEPGLYNLNNISIEAAKDGQQSGEGFFACLPLALRRSFKDDFLICRGRKVKKSAVQSVRIVSAVDVLGTAAFIGSGKVLFARDCPAETAGQVFYFRVGGNGV
jgi:tRNA(Ile)-lysidine synthase